jgi:hypothetical protein
MKTNDTFAPTPGNAMVAGLVTVMVSAWFLMAAAAIVAEPAAKRDGQARRDAPTEIAVAPEARLTITVEAPRLKS